MCVLSNMITKNVEVISKLVTNRFLVTSFATLQEGGTDLKVQRNAYVVATLDSIDKVKRDYERTLAESCPFDFGWRNHLVAVTKLSDEQLGIEWPFIGVE